MAATAPFDNTPPGASPLAERQLTPCRCAASTNQALPLAPGALTLDGVSVALNELYLLKGQTAPSENGIYQALASGQAKVGTTGLRTARIQSGTSAGKEFTVDQSTGAVTEITATTGATDGRTGAYDNTAPGQHA